MTQAQAALEASDVDARIEAACFLAERADTRERGREALRALDGRTDLAPEQRWKVHAPVLQDG